MANPRDPGHGPGREDLVRALDLVVGLRSEVADLLDVVRRSADQSGPRQRALGALLDEDAAVPSGRTGRVRALGRLGGDEDEGRREPRS